MMECTALSYNSIRIERERNGYCVRATDPAIEKKNRERKDGPWEDPAVEYMFDTKEQVLKFVEKAMDIALPEDTYSSAFDKLAKEAMKE
jgi:hypothetical protein